MDPARVLREARLRMGLSQAALARRLGIPAPAISRIENRRVTPRVDTLDHLLEACGAGLTVEQRRGAGVDRDKIRELRLVPLERLLPSGLRRALRFLSGRRVRYVLIGDAAALLLGAPIPVRQLDVCPEPEYLNRKRIRVALTRLKPRTGPPPELRSRGRQYVSLDRGRIVLWWSARGLPPFRELRGAAAELPLEGHPVPVASIDDLIRMRIAAGTRQDVSAAELLGAVREEIDAR